MHAQCRRHSPPCSAPTLSSATARCAARRWIFHAADTFDRQRLQRFLDLAQGLAARVKGVFRVGPKLWVAAAAGAGWDGSGSGSGGGIPLQEIVYRRDSRLELIVPLKQQQQGGAAAGSSGPSASAAGGGAGSAASGDGSQALQAVEGEAAALTAAMEAGRRGDWGPLEALALALLQD